MIERSHNILIGVLTVAGLGLLALSLGRPTVAGQTRTLTIFDSAGSPPINLTLTGAINRPEFGSSGTVSAISPGAPGQFLGAEFEGSGGSLTIRC